MEEHDFIMWLQGFCELTPEPPTKEQWQSIKEHLQTCFNKVTPPAPGTVNLKDYFSEWQKQRTIYEPPRFDIPTVTC